MNNTSDLSKITLKGKVCLMMAISSHPLSLIKSEAILSEYDEKKIEIIAWFTEQFNEILTWLEGENIDGKEYYKKYLREQGAWFHGYYAYLNQYIEENAFNACDCIVHYACTCMYLNSGYNHSDLPSGVNEYSQNSIFYCLEFAQQASEDPEAEKIWQDQIIVRLLKDHYTEDPGDFGGNISREYIEELLGEKLPF